MIVRTDVKGLVEYTEKTGVKLSRSLIYKLVKTMRYHTKGLGRKLYSISKQLKNGFQKVRRNK